jgi:hypothetical protein
MYPGETYDFELTADRAAQLDLDIRSELGASIHARAQLVIAPPSR